jgi:hypothetical protein
LAGEFGDEKHHDRRKDKKADQNTEHKLLPGGRWGRNPKAYGIEIEESL